MKTRQTSSVKHLAVCPPMLALEKANSGRLPLRLADVGRTRLHAIALFDDDADATFQLNVLARRQGCHLAALTTTAMATLLCLRLSPCRQVSSFLPVRLP